MLIELHVNAIQQTKLTVNGETLVDYRGELAHWQLVYLQDPKFATPDAERVFWFEVEQCIGRPLALVRQCRLEAARLLGIAPVGDDLGPEVSRGIEGRRRGSP